MANGPSNNGSNGNGKHKSGSTSGGPSPKTSKTNATIVSEVIPDKSPTDTNDYLIITLSNGLTAALISRREPNQPQHPNSSLGSRLAPTIPLYRRRSTGAFLLPSTANPACFFLPENKFQLDPSSSLPCTGYEDSIDEISNRIGPKDPTPETSVCVVVNHGSLNDPRDAEGLAHFTEHMVHYGSAKYPEEGEVSVMVQNFGMFNAFTMGHTTSYYNQVPDLILDKNLDMMSEMLTTPTFPLDVLGREVNAVDNEFQLRKSLWSKVLLLPHVAVQNREHPLATFSCGNLATLTNCQNEAGKKMQTKMAANLKQTYVATAMTVAINSTKSIDELKALVLQNFSKFNQSDHKRLHEVRKAAAENPVTLQNTKDTWHYLQGDSSQADLTMAWFLPATLWLDNTNQKAVEVLTQIISDTSAGSLDAHLRAQGWIYGLEVGVNNTQYASIFYLGFHLTEAGISKTNGVAQKAMDFINALHDSPEAEMRRVFEEIRISNLQEFQYGNQQCSVDNTLETAMRLQYDGNLNKVLSGDSWKDASFNHSIILNALVQLKDEKKLVVIESIPKNLTLEQIKTREKSSAPIQVLPHSEAKYIAVKKARFANFSNKNPAGFQLPAANPFLREELNRFLRGNGGGDAPSWIVSPPENFGNISRQGLRWKSRMDPNNDIHIPKVSGAHLGHDEVSHDRYKSSAIFNFISPFDLKPTADNQALSIIWALIIQAKLATQMSEFSLAGYKVRIIPGMKFTVDGFPKHLQEVVKTILAAMLDTTVTEAEFLLAKHLLKVMWERVMCGGVTQEITRSIVHSITSPTSELDILGTLEDLHFSDLSNAMAAFRKSAFCTVMLRGNIPVNMFERIGALLDSKNFGPYLDNNPSSLAAFTLPYAITQPHIYRPGETCIRVKSLLSNSVTTSVTNVYIMGPYVSGDDKAAKFMMGMQFLQCQAFLYLRNKLQLGYSVSARMFNTPGMMFMVHVTSTASKFTPCEIDQRIDEFLSNFGEQLKTMDGNVFNDMKTLKEAPQSLTKEAVGDYFNSKFGPTFAVPDHVFKCTMKGIRKISVQMLSGSPSAHNKECTCDKCKKLTWTSGPSFKSKLEFAVGKEEFQGYFVTSPNKS